MTTWNLRKLKAALYEPDRTADGRRPPPHMMPPDAVQWLISELAREKAKSGRLRARLARFRGGTGL